MAIDYRKFDEDDSIDLNPANKASTNKLERFKGKQNYTYRAAVICFKPLEETIYLSHKRQAKTNGTPFSEEKYMEDVNKALKLRAGYWNCEPSELADWQKLDFRVPQFKKYQVQYHQKVGSVRVLQDKSPDAEKVTKLLGEIKEYAWTLLLVYPTDENGNLPMRGDKVDVDAIIHQAKIWPHRMAPASFNAMIDKNTKISKMATPTEDDENGDAKKALVAGIPTPRMSLGTCDLTLKCKAETYQQFDLDTELELSLLVQSRQLQKKFLPMALSLQPKMVDAKEYSLETLKEKLDIASSTPSTDIADDASDFLANT